MNRDILLGALAGQMPVAAMGLPAAGVWLWDDFVDLATDNWTSNTITSAPAHALQAPGAYTEHGIHRMTTAATNNTGGVLTRSTVADLYRIPPPGSKWVTKIRTAESASYDLWSGFVSGVAAGVRTADATQFLGVRQDRAVGANLYGVVKDGAAAGNEDVVDLGVTCEASNWEAVGFDVEGDITTPTIQFYVYSLTHRKHFGRDAIGAAISTNIPSTNLFSCALGVLARTNATKAVDIDFWGLGGRTPR